MALGRFDWERRNNAKRTSPPKQRPNDPAVPPAKLGGEGQRVDDARETERGQSGAEPIQRLRHPVTRGPALRYARREQHDHQDNGKIEQENQSPGVGLDQPAPNHRSDRGKDSGPGRPGADGAAPFLFWE